MSVLHSAGIAAVEPPRPACGERAGVRGEAICRRRPSAQPLILAFSPRAGRRDDAAGLIQSQNAVGVAGTRQMSLRHLDLEALKAVPLTREPFEYFVVPGFVRPEARTKINRDYPKIAEGGSFPVAQLSYGPAFREFLDELESDEFREAFEEKFALDLAGRPTTITVRGQCSPKDGRIHTDTKSKIITILIYMNACLGAPWRAPAPVEVGRQPRRYDPGSAADRGNAAGVQAGRQFLARPQAVFRRAPRHPVQLGHLGRRSPDGDAAAPCVGAAQAPHRGHAAGRELSIGGCASRAPGAARRRPSSPGLSGAASEGARPGRLGGETPPLPSRQPAFASQIRW